MHVAYFPPRPKSGKKRGNYIETVSRLVAWLRDTLSRVRSRSLPVLAVDLNDGYGMEMGENGCVFSGTDTILESAASKEAWAGGAGQQLRLLMEELDFMAISA
eukprot:11227454-Lingulodinium_polyedra.AAC.1